MKMVKIIPIWLILFNITNNIAMDSAPQDPLRNLEYKYAFNQSEIHKKYSDLFMQQGCYDNVFNEKVADSKKHAADKKTVEENKKHCAENYDQKLIIDHKVQDRFEKECLNRLKSARNSILGQPAWECGILLFVNGCCAAITCQVVPKDSMGGSFSIFSAICNSVPLLRPLIRSGYHYLYPPEDELSSLEEKFAKNQCYIPRSLWPLIIEKFQLARKNQFEERGTIATLNSLLGLTIYKPTPHVPLSSSSYENIRNQLNKKIDSFFADYENPRDISYIKVNVAKFIKLLISNDARTPRYICLYGLGGIGKTFFIKQISDWIKEQVFDCVRLEDNLRISSAANLEGNANTAGIMLDILRTQLLENKRGTILFMDEATWLNNSSMIDPAKRVFNNDESKLSIKCFGDIANTDIKLPPMLIFVAMNEDIKDPNLKRRFDVINYPRPTKETLIRHALKTATSLDINITSDEITKWIDNLDVNNHTFNYINANIEAYFMEMQKMIKQQNSSPPISDERKTSIDNSSNLELKSAQ